MIPKVGSQVYIQSFKHDGSLHRTWDQAFVLDCDEDHYVLVTNKTWVVESDGKKWYTREPAICYFYTKRWFNTIAMIRNNGIYYYCNLASPALYDGEAVKYIDYDIDYKVYANDLVLTVDLDEYKLHSKLMHYPSEIDQIIKKEMAAVSADIKAKRIPFNQEEVEKDFQKYINILSYGKIQVEETE